MRIRAGENRAIWPQNPVTVPIGHFANPHQRLWPKSAAEDPVYGEFFKLVKKIRFQGRISIEGVGSLAQDATTSLVFFRQEIAAA